MRIKEHEKEILREAVREHDPDALEKGILLS